MENVVLASIPKLSAAKVVVAFAISTVCAACGNSSTHATAIEVGALSAAVGAGPFGDADVPAIAATNNPNQPLSPKFFAYKDKIFSGSGRFTDIEKFCIGSDCIHYGVVRINDVKIRCRATLKRESEFPRIVKGTSVRISGKLEDIDVRQIGLAEGCTII